MPWKECNKIDEKLRFVDPYLDGETIADLCREFFGTTRVPELAGSEDWGAPDSDVIATFCKPSVEYVPTKNGRPCWTRTSDQRIMSPLL